MCVIMNILIYNMCKEGNTLIKSTILLIDDNERICSSLCENFKETGYITFSSLNMTDAINIFNTKDIEVVILDLRLGKESGLDILKKIKALNPAVPIIMITGYASVESAIESMKLGAFDYVQKPINFSRLQRIVENAVKMYKTNQENLKFKKILYNENIETKTYNLHMKDLYERIKKLAVINIPILIIGESGTGKEHIAESIHNNSSFTEKEMLKINCASFPESLLDNELFGHDKGAYTGADSTFKGVFERADGSSIFLDEIGDMPLYIQSKILRVLQNNEIRRLGGKETIKINVRFIAATNKNITELIDEKNFREDLYYRLNTAIIRVPPLRERKEDIQILSELFLKEFAKENSSIVKKISDEVLSVFYQYNWPGNVRELKNTINYAASLSKEDYITVFDLPETFNKPNILSSEERAEQDKILIINTLKMTNDNKKRTAEILKISRKTLYNKLERYGLK
jgi:two-component system, NtrC family, response regulator AtoC